MTLKPGDLVVFRPHRAFGLLLRKKGQDSWVISLRSPGVENRDMIFTRIHTQPEEKLCNSIERGDLEYYVG